MSAVRIRVNVQNPATHLIGVEITFHGVGDVPNVIARLPAWSPGSYLVREYAQHVSNVSAVDEAGKFCPVRKVEKSAWQIDCPHTKSVTVRYNVYGHDLGVRNNHFDESHAFITPAATFMHLEGRLQDTAEVEVLMPPGWRAFTGLKQPVAGKFYFKAENFDELYDCPFELGPHDVFTFEVRDTPHDVVTWGRGNFDVERLKRDMAKLVEANAAIFGPDLPYERYLVINLLTDHLYGGLEHRNSTALMYPRHEFASGKGSLDAPITDDQYIGFLTLFAHEHFHTWHVKRIRPARLGPFDYARENLTRDIWTIEGVTSYYNDVTMLRAGLISPSKFLSQLADSIRRMETIPGRFVQSVEDSSFDAWIGIYRPHENNLNASVSYYLKGQIVSTLLDIYIRTESQGAKSFDDVLRYLWRHYAAERGYPEGSLETLIEEATGVDVGEVFNCLVRGTEDPNYMDFFESVGLELRRKHSGVPGPWIGVNTRADQGSCLVTSVRADGPAHGRLHAGDEIVALDGWKVTGSNLAERLRLAGVNTRVQCHVFRREELLEIPLVIREEPPNTYEIQVLPNASASSLDLLKAWLGDLPASPEEKS